MSDFECKSYVFPNLITLRNKHIASLLMMNERAICMRESCEQYFFATEKHTAFSYQPISL